jgi:hypothetical protein
MGMALVKALEHKFEFKIEGDDHDVDAENLSMLLASLSGIVGHIKNVGFPESKSAIRIVANKEGSFTIVSVLMLALNPNLISAMFQAYSSADGAEHLFEAMLELLNLKKHVQDTPVDHIEMKDSNGSLAVINKEGAVLNVVNVTLAKDYFEHPGADKLLSQLFDSVGRENKDGFKISDKKKNFKASNQECHKLKNEIIAPHLTESAIEEERTATIQLRKPDLVGKSKWDVIYLGQTISAKMLDSDFVFKVQTGKVTLSNEAKFIVQMKVRFGTDSKGKPLTSPTYEILKVYDQ